jgi:hypothetical protein
MIKEEWITGGFSICREAAYLNLAAAGGGEKACRF